MKANASTRRRPAADRRKPILYVTLAVIAVALVVTVGILSRQPSIVPQSATETHVQSALKVGDKAPNFSAATTAGPFDLATTQAPVLLEVFATWCPHCQHETRVLDDLYATYGKQINIVAVSGSNAGMDGSSPASQADVIAFAARFNVKYPIAYDGDLKVAGLYLGTGFPTLVLINKDKTISYLGDGEVAESTLAAAIQKTL